MSTEARARCARVPVFPIYNVIWFVDACLSNALRLENYIEKGAEQGKELLKKRL
jgi:hypothetical protein